MFQIRVYRAVVIWTLVLVGLYLARLHSFLLFHSLAEGFSIVVAFGVFMLAWNSRNFFDNTYLLFIGIAYFFVGVFDLLHTLSYKGMGIFYSYGANLPTQFWIGARYFGSLSLVVAPFLLGKKLKPRLVFCAFSVVSALLILGIFQGWFPDCFIEDVGQTSFKKTSEYLISLLLVSAAFFLFKKRSAFDNKILWMLVASIVLTIVSEMAFTFYVGVYDLSNLVGHYFKLLSFYLLYKAIIATGLRKPYALLFRNLKESEKALRESEEKYRTMMEGMKDPVYICGNDRRVAYMNPAMLERTGGDLTGEPCYKVMHDREEECPWCVFARVEKGERIETHVVSPKDGRYYRISHSPLYHSDRSVSKMTIFHDITEQKQAEKDILYRLEYENIVADISTKFTGIESTSIDRVIEEALAKISEFARADSGYVFQFSQDMAQFSMTHLWSNGELKTKKEALQRLDIHAMPWWMEQLKRNQPVVVPSVRDLPLDAALEKTILEQQQIQSVVDVPMVYLGVTRGFIGFCRILGEQAWTENEISLLRIIGQVFTNALQRKKVDDALHKSREILEQGVEERTAELIQKNVQLETEIEDRRTAQEAARESRRRYKELWNDAPAAYHTLDVDGHITEVNQTELSMLGYEKKEMVGKPIFDFILPSQREEAKKRFHYKLADHSIPRQTNRIYLTKEGREVYVSIDDILEKNEKGEVQGVRTTMVDITEQKLAEQALRDSEEELRRLSSQLLHVQEDERKRIARELHDSIGQSLAAIKFVAENALMNVKHGAYASGVSVLESLIPLVQQAGDEVRRIHTDLRPSLLDDLGIVSTISWFCREYQKLYEGIRIEKNVDIEEGEVPEPLKIVIFRVLQEALNNVAKYVGAGLATVSLVQKDGRIELVVQDDGNGFDMTHVFNKRELSGGFGLVNMKERTELSGGKFTIDSRVGKGTTVRAAWSINSKVSRP